MGSLGAPLTMDFVIHFEASSGALLRVSEKRQIASTGSTHDGGIELHYYEYNVYCHRSVLVGQVLQMAIMKDMDSSDNKFEWFRPGGHCSMLTLVIHPGLSVEYCGHSIPVETAQYMTMGELINHPSSNRMRLIGRMDVCACLPCCCFLPKLLNPSMIPHNQYDIYNPNHDFALTKTSFSKPMDRGSRPASSVPEQPHLHKSQPHHSSASTQTDKHSTVEHNTVYSKTPSREEEDMQALKQLKESGVLSHEEYLSKVNQVSAKYADSGVHVELAALTKLHEDGILTEQEYDTKRSVIMKCNTRNKVSIDRK